ncbi:hypothetical protein FACS1894102_0330 [Spirochaetia bacterium]|nr:hypothetical protein FACS1894102_0330 [Spirochaetia bacterium]
MQAVKAYYDGRAFVPTMPVNVKKNVTAIVTILDDEIIKPEAKEPVHTARSWDDPNSWLNNPIHIGEGYRKITRDEIYNERIDELERRRNMKR